MNIPQTRIMAERQPTEESLINSELSGLTDSLPQSQRVLMDKTLGEKLVIVSLLKRLDTVISLLEQMVVKR